MEQKLKHGNNKRLAQDYSYTCFINNLGLAE
jgi:hypothetical protein